jgi:hypothetical protein
MINATRWLPRFAVLAACVPAAAVLPGVAHATTFHQFASPSGNVSCAVGTQDNGNAFAECEIRDRVWNSPPAPADCPLSYGDRIGLYQGKQPAFGCHGDTLYDPSSPILGYGQSYSQGPISCLSQMSGITCSDSTTGHFFTISREALNIG